MGPYTLVILLAALAGGALPLLSRRSDRLLHLFIAFSTGIFLGVVFLHLLPQVAQMAQEGLMDASHIHDGQAHGTDPHGAGGPPHPGADVWFFVLLGVVGMYLLEKLVIDAFDPSDLSRHVTVGYASMLGLCVHALTAGLGLAAAGTRPELAGPMLVSVVTHKLPESFSLTSVFMLAGFPARKILIIVVIFALMTPAGMLIGGWLTELLSDSGIRVLTALAAGTFLFVSLCDLLPEVFHHRVDAIPKVTLLGLGILAGLSVHGIGE